MKHLALFSGGKDSQATIIWALNNLKEDFDIVLCDTGWEAEETYKFIVDFEAALQKPIHRIKSKKYKGLIDLAEQKGRFPSTKGRFCTTELKIKPTIDHILDTIKDDIIIYQGIRHQESANRAKMDKIDDYFRYYFEPYRYDEKGKAKYCTYRKSDIKNYTQKYDVKVYRPIITWTTQQVFKYISENGFFRNPLYDQGHTRVGCYPCIQCRQGEFKILMENSPDRLKYIAEKEQQIDNTFFPPRYIPNRFCTKELPNNKVAPTINDIKNYISKKNSTVDLFQNASCKNPFVQCE
jgi:3'-phosphoadenosine 5'-phosphosulfate sulfotransferase (PAPS reductase)/FAD synthetase